MFERLAGVWFAIVVIAVWSLVCLLLAIVFSDAVNRLLVVVLWLIIVGPLAWALKRQRDQR